MGSISTVDSTIEPAEALRIDERRLLGYLLGVKAIPSSVALVTVQQFGHGQSNPTYLLRCKDAAGHAVTDVVLRKKPPGQLLKSAHDMSREFRVISALGPTAVPVPHAIHLCQDESVIGTDFFVMSHVRGVVIKDMAMRSLPRDHRGRVFRSMIRTLAALHDVDPTAIGLGSFGNPKDFAGRQIARWARQYDAAVASEGSVALPEVVTLSQWLRQHIPSTLELAAYPPCLVHGDFRIDNLVLDAACPWQVLAVLDWELCTIGDPLSDLAYVCTMYHLPHSELLPSLTEPGLDLEGLMSEREVVEAYCSFRGLPVPSARVWSFYLALALYRICGILAGVHARALQGNAASENALRFASHDAQRGIAVAALRVIEMSQMSETMSSSAVDPVPIGSPLVRHSVSGSSSSPASPSSDIGSPPPRILDLLHRLSSFLSNHVAPVEKLLELHAASEKRWTVHPAQEALKEIAKAHGLWNLWISEDLAHAMRQGMPELDEDRKGHTKGRSTGKGLWGGTLGAGLSNYEYAFCAELMGRYSAASEACNCSAPDTGNMEVLGRYGSAEQKKHWLLPLLRGEIRSCFAMTEPDVASSDATNVRSRIHIPSTSTPTTTTGGKGATGGLVSITGRKWWASGAMDPRCSVCLFMGKSDLSAPSHKQQSIVIVPMKTPGVNVIRPLPVFGFEDAPHGHAEISFKNVAVPVENVVLGPGRGFEIAQGRLGPGRLHHCMRLMGAGQRALEMARDRATKREAFGGTLADMGGLQMQLARARIGLEAARLLVLRAASAIDAVGAKGARFAIAAAKVAAPEACLKAVDLAIQIHGAAGVSSDTPLSWLWAQARTLRIADGPDEVHLGTLGKREIRSRM